MAVAIGLAPNEPLAARRARAVTGSSEASSTAGLSQGSGPLVSDESFIGLEVFSQVHSPIEARHQVAISVEGQRFSAAELADATLGGLAPAGMVHFRIDVGVKAVLARSGDVPGGRRLLLDEADYHDRLDSLESVLPGDHQAQRSAVLIGQRLAVQTDRQER